MINKMNRWLKSISDLTKTTVFISVFFGCIALHAYVSPEIRLDHYASLATVLGSLATAGTLIWLVLERDQLQKEKRGAEKRKQAVGVSTWLSSKTFDTKAHYKRPVIILNNNSDSPIYNLVVSIVDARNTNAKGEETPEEFRRVIDNSPPGQVFCFTPEGYNGMGFRAGVELAFSDTNSNHWVRRGNGKLENLTEDPFTHYKILQPPIYEDIHEL